MTLLLAGILPTVYALLIPLGILAVFFVLTVGIGVWERRRIHVYQPMRASHAPGDEEDNGPEWERFLPMTKYGRTTILAMKARGFQSLGAFRHGMKGTYKVRYDIFLSPDREILAIVGGG